MFSLLALGGTVIGYANTTITVGVLFHVHLFVKSILAYFTNKLIENISNYAEKNKSKPK